jgi:hypothetical protein
MEESTMKILSSLIIKFVMVTAVLWIVLGIIFGVSFGDIFLTSMILTVISLAGDMFVLPKYGNVSATIADFGLSLVLIWLVGAFLYEQPIRLGMAAFVSAIMIAVGEFLFHKYIQKQLFTSKNPSSEISLFQMANLQTEFASEHDIEKPVEGNSMEKNSSDRNPSYKNAQNVSKKRK